MSSNNLFKILDENATSSILHPERADWVVNHNAHGLIAMSKLGATEEQLLNYNEWHNTGRIIGWKMEKPHTHDYVKINSFEDLLELRGKYSNYLGIVEFFKEEIKREGTSAQQLLPKYLPYATEGVVARLVHPIINLAYAIEAQHDDLIVDGLSYMFFAFQSTGSHKNLDFDELVKNLDESSEAFVPQSVLELIKSVQAQGKIEEVFSEWEATPTYQKPRGGALQTRIAIICEKATEVLDGYIMPLLKNPSFITPFLEDQNKENGEEYKKVVTRLFDGILWLYNEISETNNESNFAILHGVTSCWSLTRILPYLSSIQRLETVLYFVRALIAVWSAVWEEKDFKIGLSPEERNWEEHYAEIPEFSASIESALNPIKNFSTHPTKVIFTCINRVRDPHFVPVESKNFLKMLKIIAARQYNLLPWKIEP
mmetsp:Transcript_63984/g.73408  ORF Transcript_63984/g.73408 Transcript_63984/m.73408 type:complete len:427 (-) Transcript_63984:124-1404(-)